MEGGMAPARCAGGKVGIWGGTLGGGGAGGVRRGGHIGGHGAGEGRRRQSRHLRGGHGAGEVPPAAKWALVDKLASWYGVAIPPPDSRYIYSTLQW